jgi:hypothetical protein
MLQQHLRSIVPCVEEQGDTSDGQLDVPSVAGRWHLLAWRSIGDDGAIAGHPFGENPLGAVIYTPGGWMAGQLAATSRPAVDGADPLAGPQDQRAAAYSTDFPDRGCRASC